MQSLNLLRTWVGWRATVIDNLGTLFRAHKRVELGERRVLQTAPYLGLAATQTRSVATVFDNVSRQQPHGVQNPGWR